MSSGGGRLFMVGASSELGPRKVSQVPVWVSVLNPVVTLIVAVLAFYLGKEQGREQTRFVKRAEVMNELRARIFDVRNNMGSLASLQQSPGRESLSESLTAKVYDLVFYRRKEGLWLPPEVEGTVDEILDTFTDVASLLLRDEGIDDVVSGVRYAEAVERAQSSEVDGLIEDLEERAATLTTPKPSLPRAVLLTVWDDVREGIARNRKREE
ncbi:MAG: hypothetical protein H0X71_05920 [Rubrobacter sp.]|nr:hypothetical protein [Rubrobacter sp.]